MILEPEDLGDNWENCRRDYPPEFVNTRFEARDGTHSSQEVIGNNRLLYRYLMNEETGQNEWMVLDTNGDPWNPTRFRLTTQDGLVMNLHARRGIESLTDLEGNTVSYSETAKRPSATAAAKRSAWNETARTASPASPIPMATSSATTTTKPADSSPRKTPTAITSPTTTTSKAARKEAYRTWFRAPSVRLTVPGSGLLPDYRACIEKVAKTLGMSIFAMDFLCDDHRIPMADNEAYCLEVNARPAWMHHTFS